jgi:deazaflavin-dependent oxidoreductase (nitroreductase family)
MALGDFKRALTGTNELGITVTGRRSGRSIATPVWFVLDGEKLYLLPMRGSASDWYRNVRKTPTIRLDAAGTAWTGQAAPITDAASVRDVVAKFAAKYGAGAAQRYYSTSDVAVEIPLT